jgi:hypothetical protein
MVKRAKNRRRSTTVKNERCTRRLKSTSGFQPFLLSFFPAEASNKKSNWPSTGRTY